ncbi:MAG: hypothetical protein V1779_09180 [bacterium]
MSEVNKQIFWDSFLKAVETEPVEAKPIQGISGIYHDTTAIGVDEKRKRLVIISSEPDSRNTILIQSDIKSKIKEYHIILARPAVVNLGYVASFITTLIGNYDFSMSELNELVKDKIDFQKRIEKYGEQLKAFHGYKKIINFDSATISIISMIKEVIDQLSMIKMTKEVDDTYFSLKDISLFDPASYDREQGICPVPLYEFEDFETIAFQQGNNHDYVRHILEKKHILQYFFPSPDYLAIGLISSSISKTSDVISKINEAPHIGHPLGENDLLDKNISLLNIIDALKDKKYAVDGEICLEVTEEGKKYRNIVRYQPREGFLKKLSNVLSIKLDFNIKDLFRNL